MTILQIEDQRNLEWRTNNVGSSLLQKMGWREGSGIGKRASNSTALRAVKRQDGLGLGAKMATEGGQSESTSTFAAVLANLQMHHGSSHGSSSSDAESSTDGKASKKKSKGKGEGKKSKRPKKRLVLPQNKVIAGHAKKMRLAKFGEKSAEDLACIFGNTNVAPALSTPPVVASRSAAIANSARSSADKGEKEKKAKKRSREEKEDNVKSTSTKTNPDAEEKDGEETSEKKKRRKEKEDKKAKKKNKTS